MHAMPAAAGKHALAIVLRPKPHAPREAMDAGVTTDPRQC